MSATRDGVPLGGEAYVELTGYSAGERQRPSSTSAVIVATA